jgi:hypothetical protein
MNFNRMILSILALAIVSFSWAPLGRPAYTTSSFGENRGTRYHAGVDWSTEMQEGWPVLAPENGQVYLLRQTPSLYGRNLLFRGKSGHIWVFAHLSGFAPRLDLAFEAQKLANRKNDFEWNLPGGAVGSFKEGDTLAFSGSTGIGNPHLHVEFRDSTGTVVLNPCLHGVACSDTLPPTLIGAAVWDASNPDGLVRLTSATQIAQGCLQVDPSFRNPRMALKIADYSREPRENPMSVFRILVRQNADSLFEKEYHRQTFGKMVRIREELLWSEETDTAGDWHHIGRGSEENDAIEIWNAPELAKALSAKKNPRPLQVEIVDQAQNQSSFALTPQALCPVADSLTPPPLRKLQDSLLFTFLARPWMDLSLCSSQKFRLLDLAGKGINANPCASMPHTPTPLRTILSKWPKTRQIEVAGVAGSQPRVIHVMALPSKIAKPISWKENGVSLFFDPAEPMFANALAWEKVNDISDSVPGVTPGWVFHPKGLHLKGNLEVCVNLPDSLPPQFRTPVTSLRDSSARNIPRLFWLGETARVWFIFSKQTINASPGRVCANLDELRDLTFSVDTLAPEIGEPRDTLTMVRGKPEAVIRIPVTEWWAGIPDGNAIKVTQGNKWIPAEFDSEPSEIVILKAAMTPNSPIRIEVRDEMGNTAVKEIR